MRYAEEAAIFSLGALLLTAVAATLPMELPDNETALLIVFFPAGGAALTAVTAVAWVPLNLAKDMVQRAWLGWCERRQWERELRELE